jgi:hypothetical protein
VPIRRNQIRRLADIVLRRLGLAKQVCQVIRTARLVRQGLRDTGWLLSAASDAPVGARGEPVPWFTYPAIALLAERLAADARVFEWGAGHSTIWFARRVAHVVSIEADAAWARYVRLHAPGNVDVIHVPDSDAYVEAIRRKDERFDVVVVDGIKGRRYACGRLAVGSLSHRAVIVWDNADRPEFNEAWRDYLAPGGFRCLRLRGFGPLGWREWETAIIYRDGNVLGI